MFDEPFFYTKPEKLELHFDPPIKSASGGALSKLSLGEPSSGQVYGAESFLVAKNGNRAQRMFQRALVAKVGGVPDEALDNLPISSFTKAAAYLQAFVDTGYAENTEEAAAAMPDSFTITFAEPIGEGDKAITSLRLGELTLGQMAKADTVLGDLSRQRLRAWQEQIVTASSGESPIIIAQLPVSVLNMAASFVAGFSNAGRTIST